MAADLSETMFDAWTQASLLSRIQPATLYWRRLAPMTEQWISYVSFLLVFFG
jgi:hypothetical protein